MAWASGDTVTSTKLNHAGMAGPVFNIKDPVYGAVGDNSNDDTSALTGAINAALIGSTVSGGIVYLPQGVYTITESLDIPEGVTLVGDGPLSSIISWAGSLSSTPETAPITSNLTGQWTWATAAGMENLTINASGASYGVTLRGWNEFCHLRNVQIRSAKSICLVVESVETGSSISRPTHQAHFAGLQILPVGGATGMELNGVRRCTFTNITVDQTGGGSTPITDGIVLARDVNQNVFMNMHLEDCTRGFDIGRDAANINNTFVNLNFDVSQSGVSPASSTNSGDSGTMAIRIQPDGMDEYTVLSLRDSYGYDYILNDPTSAQSVRGQGSGAGATNPGSVIRNLSTSLEFKQGDVRLPNNSAYRIKTVGNANASAVLLDTSDNLILGDSTQVDDIRFNVGGLASAAHFRETTGILDMSASTVRLAESGAGGGLAGDATGTAGDIAWGSSSGNTWLYVCTSADSWHRTELNPF